MSSSTVLVYEFFTGGGCRSKDVPAGLAAEALGMIWALLSDFKLWGNVHTVAAIDSRYENRIPGLNRTTLPADSVVSVTEASCQDTFHSLLGCCDAVLIIAPETDGILSALTEQAESAGIPVLGSSSAAITIAGNKALCHRVFQNENLPTPRTHCMTFASGPEAVKRMSFPLVIKPVDGAGSEGVCRVDCFADFSSALEKIRGVTQHEQFLVQAYAAGQHISVSVLSTQNECRPICVNLQLIETGSPFRYLGSLVPYQDQAAPRIMDLACSAVRAIPGLRGYVGVDLVLGQGSAQLIEINPRLTTSYIGLRQVSRVNLAQAIWEACMCDILPAQIPIFGQAVIKKDNVSTWGLSDWLK